jgi:hypothetical protein
MANKPETKDFKFVLEEMDDDTGTFTGYASIFGVADSYNDIVMAGAFKRTIKNNKGKGWPMLWSHKVDEPIGLIRGEEDERGLKVRGAFNMDDPLAIRIRSHMKQGSVTGLSIGYQTVLEEMDRDTGVRKLKEIKLWEISPVVFPACDPARVEGVKGAGPDELKPFPNEHACRLRDPGDFEDSSFVRTTRKHNGKTYSVIQAKLEGEDGLTDQAYRYSKDTWTADEARAHCRAHAGKFESAKCNECSHVLEGDPNPTPPNDSAERHSFIVTETARILRHRHIWQ